ncbi:MAG: biotin--[acetyl-CoA-carboxylase] ligase [Thermomicrobiales bacterium]
MNVTRDGAWAICRYDTVDSTQRVAADLIAAGAADRTAVVADRQSAGYGRKGDVWHDAPGASLLVTLILRPERVCHPPHLAMIAALAVVDVIAEVGNARPVLKWPNDVLLNDRKVAGILGDATWRGLRLEAIRLGIGINVGGDRALYARRSLPDATSIAAETDVEVDPDTLLTALLDHFSARQDRLALGAVDETVDAWRRALVTIGRAVVVTLRDGRVIYGIAENVTSDGDLIVLAEDGKRMHLAATETRSLRHVFTPELD